MSDYNDTLMQMTNHEYYQYVSKQSNNCDLPKYKRTSNRILGWNNTY